LLWRRSPPALSLLPSLSPMKYGHFIIADFPRRLGDTEVYCFLWDKYWICCTVSQLLHWLPDLLQADCGGDSQVSRISL
jgi:hypothetical protein